MIPTRFEVSWRRRLVGEDLDPHGNPVVSFAQPVTLPVHGIEDGGGDWVAAAGRDTSKIAHTLYLPAGPLPRPGDLLVLDGEELVVDLSRDWTKGPWIHPDAGMAVAARRKEG